MYQGWYASSGGMLTILFIMGNMTYQTMRCIRSRGNTASGMGLNPTQKMQHELRPSPTTSIGADSVIFLYIEIIKQ